MQTRSKRSIRQSYKPIVYGKKTQRNEPCPCGSGLKYKKCCLEKTENNQININQ